MMIRRRKAGLRSGHYSQRATGDIAMRPRPDLLSGAELRRIVAEMVD